MNASKFSLLVFATSLHLAGCERKAVTSSETLPASPVASPATLNLPPPVIMPASALGGQQGAVSTDESAAFEAWFLKYGIDSKNPAALAADSDGDGYSNREEFLAGTNPLDPNSMPGMIEGVVMKEMKEVRVPLVLRQVKDRTARVDRLDTNAAEELREGSTPSGLPYRVTSVKYEVKPDKHGVFTDVSQLTMENSETKETVVLVRDLPARSSETHAVLVGPGGAEMKVRVDEVISLPGQGDKRFKVLELRPDQVVVEEVGSRKPLTIPMRSETGKELPPTR